MSAPVPLVSIGLPVYNGEAYLAEAIEDFLGQSLGDFELVVCDNASTDSTEAIARAAADRDPRVRYIRNARNVGALPNANRAFRHSRGRYYCLASHDDRHAPHFLTRLVEALDNRPEAVVAYGRKGLIDGAGRPIEAADGGRYRVRGVALDYDAALERPLPDAPVARYRAALASNDPNAVVYGLFRREVLARLPAHHVNGSDRLLVAAAALHGPFAFVDEELLRFRIHEDSTCFLGAGDRVEREAGDTLRASALDPARTFVRYLHAVADAPLTRAQRSRAYLATVRTVGRRGALRRLLSHFGGEDYSRGSDSPDSKARLADSLAPTLHPQSA